MTCERCGTPLINDVCPRCIAEDADEQARFEAGRDERRWE